MEISSASTNQIKRWRKLLMSKYRKRENLFLAEGERCVEQILQNGIIKVREVVQVRETAPKRFIHESGVQVYSVSERELSEITDTESPQGVVAICETPVEADPAALTSAGGTLLAIDALQDPGNLGTIIRTASWFGINGLLFGKGTVDPFHPKVVRSTAGATGAIPYLSGDLESIIEPFEEAGWQVQLLDAGADSKPIQSLKPAERTLLVVGNEANGIRPNLFDEKRKRVRIDGNSGVVESLNAAVACSIAMFQLENNR
ncbi:MAG: hypothetical protein GVY08_11150 [Bacteroidetes bacterium]|jgi:TrmH family RNA methyltransferase|nr:hypothetical protein [Bacteroidota bacterium]